MSDSPLISIVIPSFQQGVELEGALRSIARQTTKNYEILIIDGLSKDNTAYVVSKYSDLPITFRSESDNGIYDAMNKGIAMSKGKFIYFMGCDDRLASNDILEKISISPYINTNHVIYGDVLFKSNKARYEGEFTYFKLILRNICHQAIFTRRDVFEKIGNFDIRYKTYADWEFNMRWFSKSWVKRQYIPLIIAEYNDLGFSSNLQDDVFFKEETFLKKKYFPNIVRYLANNENRFLHWRTITFLNYNRITFLKTLPIVKYLL